MSSSDAVDKKMVVLMSSDGETFQVEEKVAIQSQTIKNFVEDCGDDSGNFPLPNVRTPVLAKVVEYLKQHVNDDNALADPAVSKNEDLDKFDQEFVKVDQDMLFDILLAANYLNVEKLLNLLCKTVADMMRGKDTEQIRQTFNIKNDYTPEEEEEVRWENSWAFE